MCICVWEGGKEVCVCNVCVGRGEGGVCVGRGKEVCVCNVCVERGEGGVCV